jgi:hypothetical protein
MAEIVNLRRARKAKARAEAQATAAENRIRFGRTAQEKKQGAAQKALEAKRLEGHRRDDDDNQG